MLSVSEDFLRLAQSSGRHVFCRIEAGTEVFLDDRILEFDFDDVVHPDWVTIGATCANRFSFSVRYDGELYVRDVVKPFISFDGEEWCPLGVFFVARRYVRGNYASITCYDQMYSLDMEYKSELSFPADTAAVLSEICARYGIECGEQGGSYQVDKIPDGCTVRDMIGYIAGLKRANAKMDRNGALVFKTLTGVASFMLYDKNCWSIQRNMAASVITCLKAGTENGELVSGDGAEISTVEFYNPLMTKDRLDQIYHQLRPLSFYGADIEMQGMPFIESGDAIQLHEGKLLYHLMVSEVEYHYDGGLSARLYSKNRSYSDAVVHTDDLKAAIEELRNMLRAFCFKQMNDEQISVSETEQTAAEFEFETTANGFAQLDVNATVDGFTADSLIIRAYVNGIAAAHTAVQLLGESGNRQVVHYCWLAENLPIGKNRITVTLQTKSGNAYIMPSMLLATLVGHGGISGTGVRDRLSFSEKIEGVPMSDMMFGLQGMDCSLSAQQEGG